METIGHHSCKKEGGKEFVSKEAPFLSEYNDVKRKYPFLGTGFYFWDDNIEAAKWWGDTAYRKQYYVIESKLNLHGIILDLVGNRGHMKWIVEMMDKMKKRGYESKKWPLGAFVEYLKLIKIKDNRVFPYTAIRAVDNSPIPEERFKFSFVKQRKKNYTNLNPRLVICLTEKNSLVLQSINIVHES